MKMSFQKDRDQCDRNSEERNAVNAAPVLGSSQPWAGLS